MRTLLLFLGLLTGLAIASPAQTRLLARTGSSSSVISISVTFASAPTSTTANYAPLKYNKDGALSIESDDNSYKSLNMWALFHGGTATDGTVYPGATFSDGSSVQVGCSGRVDYRAGLAVNAQSGYDNHYIGLNAGELSWAQIAEYVRNRWTMSNHSWYHPGWQRFGWGNNWGRLIIENDRHWYEALKGQGVEYVIRTGVVPSGYSMYGRIGDSLRYLGFTSQGVTDPGSAYWTAPYGQAYVHAENLPNGYVFLTRYLYDSWTQQSQVTTAKAGLDQFLAYLTPSKHAIWRFFSHNFEISTFSQFHDYLVATAGDRLWIVGLQELLEYNEVKYNVRRSEVRTGNTLVITLNYDHLDARNRCKDLSLLVKSNGPTITGVTVSGADSYSYNPSTGLINVFKETTSGFPVPPKWKAP